MRSTWGIFLVLTLLLPACGTGHRLDETEDGGGIYLPTVSVVDSGNIILTNGVFDGGSNDLVIADTPSRTKIRLLDQTAVYANNDLYDLDSDGDLDYIVLVLRPLSAQAAACTLALKDGSYVDLAEFDKVGGAGFEPHDASFSPGIELTLGISDAAEEATGQSIDIYKFDPDYAGPHSTSADIGTGSGVWNYYTSVSVSLDDSVRVATFDVSRFGEYCVVTDVPETHDEGSASSL